MMYLSLVLFIFCGAYADTTWPMYGATLENTHYQKMIGAMLTEPYVKWSYQTGGDVEAYGAAVADVNGDDTMEVVTASMDSTVYCLNGVTGKLKWSYKTGDDIRSTPATGNVDEDDTIEVVIGSLDKKVYCLNGVTGLVKWSYEIGRTVSSPAIANVNKDDTMNIIVGSFDAPGGKIYCLNGVTGLVEWSYTAGDNVYCAPAVADVNKDDTIEIVFGSYDHKVYCLNGVTGLVKWSYETGGWIEHSSPAVADVNGDDTIEVVIGSRDHTVYCLNGVTGLVKWSYETGKTVTPPAIADLDENDTLEVIFGSWDSTVYCLNGVTGLVKWSYPTGGRYVHRGISIADIDGGESGECKLELLLPSNTTDSLVCLNGEDGSVLWIKKLVDDIHDITIADIDLDGCVELIVGTRGDSGIYALDDIGNRSDCKCGASVEERDERLEIRDWRLEFRVMGRGIYLFTPNAMDVDIRVYDLCGRLRQIVYKGVLSKGGHTFIPNIRSSGIYFVVLEYAGGKDSVKLIRIM